MLLSTIKIKFSGTLVYGPTNRLKFKLLVNLCPLIELALNFGFPLNIISILSVKFVLVVINIFLCLISDNFQMDLLLSKLNMTAFKELTHAHVGLFKLFLLHSYFISFFDISLYSLLHCLDIVF